MEKGKGVLEPLTKEEWEEVIDYYNSTPIVPMKAIDGLVEYIVDGNWRYVNDWSDELKEDLL